MESYRKKALRSIAAAVNSAKGADALVLLATISLVMAGCAPTTYITPDYKEYTTGRIFADKYWNPLTRHGTGVKLEGRFKGVSTTMLNGIEQLFFKIEVPGGLKQVTVYADRVFATQLYEAKNNSMIVVYGETMIVTLNSRMDRGETGGYLAVRLDKLEVL